MKIPRPLVNLGLGLGALVAILVIAAGYSLMMRGVAILIERSFSLSPRLSMLIAFGLALGLPLAYAFGYLILTAAEEGSA